MIVYVGFGTRWTITPLGGVAAFYPGSRDTYDLVVDHVQTHLDLPNCTQALPGTQAPLSHLSSHFIFSQIINKYADASNIFHPLLCAPAVFHDERRGALSDHDRGRVRVAARNPRAHRRVGHAQPAHAAQHAQPRPDDAARVVRRAHPRGAHGVVDRQRAAADRFLDVRVGRRVQVRERGVEHLVLDVEHVRERRRARRGAREAVRGDARAQVARVREVARVDDLWERIAESALGGNEPTLCPTPGYYQELQLQRR